MSEARDVDAVAHHVVVPRTARVYTLGDAGAPRDVWVALHGYGQLAAYFARHFAPHAGGRRVVVPEALSRFYLETQPSGKHGQRVGATWMTREDRETEIADYVRYLDLALESAAPGAGAPLNVLGFSQGAATACRWLAARDGRGAAPAARLVLWAGEVPPDLDLRAEWLRRTKLTFVVGNEDPFITPERLDAYRERLDGASVPYELVSFEGDHRMEPETLARVIGS